jgi:hypothetical protein
VIPVVGRSFKVTTVKKGFIFGAALVALCYLNWSNTSEEPKVAATFAGVENAAAPSANSGSTSGAIASAGNTQ